MSQELLEMKIILPRKVLKFYKKVAKRSGTDIETVISVVLSLQSAKSIEVFSDA